MTDKVWVGSATFKFDPEITSGIGAAKQVTGNVVKEDNCETESSAVDKAREKARDAAGYEYVLASEYPVSQSFEQVDSGSWW